MARSPRSPSLWPTFPGIPIYLETHDERAAAKSYGTTPTTPTTPEILPHTKSNFLSPDDAYVPQQSPINPSPTTTIQTTSDRSIIWPIPEPPEVIQQQQPRRPLLRFFPTDRPRVRLDNGLSITTAFDKGTSEKPLAENSKRFTNLGLGIRNGPPKAPSIRIQPPQPLENEKAEPNANIAQRIEEKIWNYNTNGNVVERWLLEIISWLVSAICMGAIIATLFVLRDQSVDKWPFAKMGLTLNAFVSILSRIAGAALLLPVAEAIGQLKWSWFMKGGSKKMWDFEMFDNASRGPWGSLQLLIHTKGKTIAALGALVTLFALALDPFFQQVLLTPQRWHQLEANGTISRAVRYEPRYPVEFLNGVQSVTNDLDMLNIADPFFIANGTQLIPFGNGTRPDIPLYCPSSKCTWPSHETLSMCSQCVEVPKLLTYGCVDTRVDWTSQLNATIASYPNATVCGHFLNITSKNPILMSGYALGKDGKPTGETLIMRTLPLITNGMRELLWGGSINFQNIRNPITDVLISGSTNKSQVHANLAPTLHECVLTWCVKTIEATYQSGMYMEEVKNTLINTTATGSKWANTATSDGSNDVDLIYTENVTISAPSTGSNFSRYGWGVSNTTMVYTTVIFDRIFPAFTTVNNTSEPLLRWRTGHPTQVRTQIPSINPWLPPNNITNHMERLAEAVGNGIRSSLSNELLQGHAYDEEVYVLVRWAWLSLPVGLLLVSLIFLVATVVKSAAEKDRVSIRKNSAIATLLHGLPDHYKKRLAKRNSKGTPRPGAKELRVGLSPTRGWWVDGNLFSPATPTVPRNVPPPGWI
ncbi:hypothetical protein GQ44DRAFT_822891 [Phaeosphaeriaceae sp. PMI808]|nr:hypothetical protein GQ44DRAFT_822891 [Phaeosphaeriaceae sp. PMI808]